MLPIKQAGSQESDSKTLAKPMECCTKSASVAIMYNDKLYVGESSLTICYDRGVGSAEAAHEQACREAYSNALIVATNIARNAIIAAQQAGE